MKDFLIASKSVQPSAKREGFAVVPDVTWGKRKDKKRKEKIRKEKKRKEEKRKEEKRKEKKRKEEKRKEKRIEDKKKKKEEKRREEKSVMFMLLNCKYNFHFLKSLPKKIRKKENRGCYFTFPVNSFVHVFTVSVICLSVRVFIDWMIN